MTESKREKPEVVEEGNNEEIKQDVGLALLNIKTVNDIAEIPVYAKRLKMGGSLLIVSKEEELGNVVDDVILEGLDMKRLLVNVPKTYNREVDNYSQNKVYIIWAVNVSKRNRVDERWIFNKPENLTFHTGAFEHDNMSDLYKELVGIHSNEDSKVITNTESVLNLIKPFREDSELLESGLAYTIEPMPKMEVVKDKELEIKVNEIVQEDCFDILANIEPESVDLVVTDPPYNISVENSSGAYGKGRNGMDFGAWDFGFDTEKWLHYLAPVTREGGSVIIFNSYKNIGVMTKVMKEYGYELKGIPFWLKTNPIPHFPERLYVSSMEHAVWFVKTNGKEDVKYTFNLPEGSRFERGVFRVSHHDKQNERFHTTQKPVKLFNEIIRTHSNEGDVVLDTFMGSGTTAVCAMGLGRDFIGCELSDEYFDKTTARVNKTKRKPKSLWG